VFISANPEEGQAQPTKKIEDHTVGLMTVAQLTVLIIQEAEEVQEVELVVVVAAEDLPETLPKVKMKILETSKKPQTMTTIRDQAEAAQEDMKEVVEAVETVVVIAEIAETVVAAPTEVEAANPGAATTRPTMS
jgi:hypothetical protein